jgi:hypothetical protein
MKGERRQEENEGGDHKINVNYISRQATISGNEQSNKQ